MASRAGSRSFRMASSRAAISWVCLGGPVRELPHLIGHHGKTPACGSGVGRLDGGIEAEHPGAIGDLPDHQGDLVHLEDMAHQGFQAARGDLRLLLKLTDRGHGLSRFPAAPGCVRSAMSRVDSAPFPAAEAAWETLPPNPSRVAWMSRVLVRIWSISPRQRLHSHRGPRRPGRRAADDLLQTHEVLGELC